jgi:hypothetical protein
VRVRNRETEPAKVEQEKKGAEKESYPLQLQLLLLVLQAMYHNNKSTTTYGEYRDIEKIQSYYSSIFLVLLLLLLSLSSPRASHMNWYFHKSVTKENNKIINDFYGHKLI